MYPPNCTPFKHMLYVHYIQLFNEIGGRCEDAKYAPKFRLGVSCEDALKLRQGVKLVSVPPKSINYSSLSSFAFSKPSYFQVSRTNCLNGLFFI